MKNILFVYILFLSIPSIGQVNLPDLQTGLDSLWGVWNDHNQPDTIRLEAIQNIAWDGYLFSQPDSAFYFAQLGYDFAKSRALKNQMAKTLNILGVSFWVQGEYTSAIDYYTRSLTIKEEIGDKKGIAGSLNNIGLIYNEQGDYASAIDYYTRSLITYEEMGDKNGIAISLNNIGLIYNNQGDYASAIDYHTRSLTIREEIGDKKGIAGSLNNIGLIYNNQGDYVSAIDYYTRSLTIKEEIRDKKGIAGSLNNIGLIYKKRGDSAYTAGNTALSADRYTSAIDYYTRSLNIREEIRDKKGIASSSNNLGSIYNDLGNYTSSVAYNTRALITAQEIGAATETRDAANTLYEAYKATGSYKPALEMHELYMATRDSIDSEENQREVIRQKYKYEYEKQAVADSVAYVEGQKVQVAKLEKSKIQQFSLVGGLVLLIGFSVLMYNRFRVTRRQKITIEKQSQEALVKEKELTALKTKFISNVSHEFRTPLTVIQSNVELISHYLENSDQKNKGLTAKNRVISEISNMKNILEDLLNQGKETQNIEDNLVSLDLVSLISELTISAQNSEQDSRSVELNIKGNPKEITTNDFMMRRIILNLLTNALKYSSNSKKAPIVDVVFSPEQV